MPAYDKLTAYMSGRFVPLSEARVSIFDTSLVYGDMVFEMTRSFQRRPFRLEQHLDRLYNSLNLAEIDCGLTKQQLHDVSLQAVEANLPFIDEDLDYYIMHDVSRGPVGYFKRAFPDGAQPTVVVAIWPLIEHLATVADAYDRGVAVVIPNQKAIPSRYLDPKAKSRSRLHYQIANLQAERIEPGAWALLLDEHGFVAEGTSCNFFVVHDGTLYTPEARNILRGVSRGFVMELAQQLNIPCVERNFEPYDVMTADEAFFTASSFCVLPATRFEGRPVGTGEVGPVVRRLLQAWGEAVGVDLIAQARHCARWDRRLQGQATAG